MERVFYSSSVHDDAEIDAVVDVLRSGPQGLWPGRRVNAMERQVAELFAKSFGVMVNSGSSALYLAVELLDLQPGDEVVTCALTFSTDIAPLVRKGITPVLIDCELDTYCVDVARIEAAISPRTRALLFPNLIGNAPDWDAVAERKTVRPALAGSIESILHDVGLPQFALHLRDERLAGFATPLLERAIGVIYRPQTERQSHYFQARVTEQFDALIHLDRSTALVPLEPSPHWWHEEVPETYPSGL